MVNHLVGLSLPRNSVVRLTDRPDMTKVVYRGRNTHTHTHTHTHTQCETERERALLQREREREREREEAVEFLIDMSCLF